MGSVYLAAILCHFRTDLPSQYVITSFKDFVAALQDERKQLHMQAVTSASHPQKYVFLCVTKMSVSLVSQKETQEP